MKILVVGPFSSPIIQRLAKNLKDNGHEILVASHSIENSENVIDLGRLNSFFGYCNFTKINKIVRDFQPDIVHAHVVNHYGLMSLIQEKPLVVAMWGSDVMLAPNSGNPVKRLVYRTINWLVMKRAKRCHTSGFHVAEEANRQCDGVLKKTDIFYWGFPLEMPDDEALKSAKLRVENEFGILDEDLVVFPRGLGPVYNPKMMAVIINKLLTGVQNAKKIVVLKGFSNSSDEDYFKKIVDTSAITYVDRLLTSDELYFLYTRASIHFSIPLSDSLGGGVVEPALFGSYPILSNIPSYKKYTDKYNGLILKNYNAETIDFMCAQIHGKKIGKSPGNIPVEYTLKEVLENITSTYKKAINL